MSLNLMKWIVAYYTKYLQVDNEKYYEQTASPSCLLCFLISFYNRKIFSKKDLYEYQT